MRQALPGGLLGAALLSVACAQRQRPSPTQPEGDALLSVQVLVPPFGQTVVAGAPLTVRINGQEFNGGFLAGLGFVARRTSAGSFVTVDSAAVRFTFRRNATLDFTLHVPASLATNTQIDIYGIAFGPGTQSELSSPSSVVVAQCPPGNPGCP